MHTSSKLVIWLLLSGVAFVNGGSKNINSGSNSNSESGSNSNSKSGSESAESESMSFSSDSSSGAVTTPPLVTPAPVTPAPVTPAPVTPAPIATPAPVTPVTPAPVEPVSPETTPVSQGIAGGDGSDQEPATTDDLSDEELCNCFSLNLVGCGPERIGDRVCYYYRFEGTCGRRSDYVRFFLSTKDMSRCGLTETDLPDLVRDSSPSSCTLSGESNTDADEYQLDVNYADGDEESRLFSMCFETTRVGGTRADGEFGIGFGGGKRTVRCSAPGLLPDICEVETTTLEPTTQPSAEPTPAPTTTAPTTAAPTTPAPVTPEQTTTTPSPVTPAPVTAAPTTTTTLAPSAAPTYVACATDDAFNIAFLLDESGSVDTTEWDVIKQFVARIATFDVAGPSYVSLFEYASLVAFTQFQGWTNLATGEQDIVNALERNPYNEPGMTYTWDAVNRVLDEFYAYRTTCDDGCDTRQDILFLLTDGAPSDSVCPDMIARVNQSSVDIVIVGIGADSDAWMDQVSCLDYRDGGADIFYVTEFDSDGFNAIEGMIRAKTCNGENPAGESDRGGDPWEYADGSTDLGPVPTASGDRDAPEDATLAPGAAKSVVAAAYSHGHDTQSARGPGKGFSSSAYSHGHDTQSASVGFDFESLQSRNQKPHRAPQLQVPRHYQKPRYVAPMPTSSSPDTTWVMAMVLAIGGCFLCVLATMVASLCVMRSRVKGGYASPAEQMYMNDAEK